MMKAELQKRLDEQKSIVKELQDALADATKHARSYEFHSRCLQRACFHLRDEMERLQQSLQTLAACEHLDPRVLISLVRHAELANISALAMRKNEDGGIKKSKE